MSTIQVLEVFKYLELQLALSLIQTLSQQIMRLQLLLMEMFVLSPLQACTLRNNQLHFGGFPGTGRTILNNKSICILPWIHQYGDLSGRYGLCCFTLNHKNNLFGEGLSLLEAFNSKHMKNARLAMLSGKRIRDCKVCYEVGRSRN